MKRIVVLLLFSILLISCGSEKSVDSYIIENSDYEGRYVAKIVRIIDGDTFVSFANNDSLKIRLSGVDTPEMGNGKSKLHQPYANKAKEYMTNLILGQEVLIIPKEKDRYGRLVAWVFLDDIDISEELLKAGLAWHFVKYDSNDNYTRFEKKARSKRIGLWEDNVPIAPWEWRKMKKEEKEEYMSSR